MVSVPLEGFAQAVAFGNSGIKAALSKTIGNPRSIQFTL
jgi:hypothetical protein